RWSCGRSGWRWLGCGWRWGRLLVFDFALELDDHVLDGSAVGSVGQFVEVGAEEAYGDFGVAEHPVTLTDIEEEGRLFKVSVRLFEVGERLGKFAEIVMFTRRAVGLARFDFVACPGGRGDELDSEYQEQSCERAVHATPLGPNRRVQHHIPTVGFST